MASVDELAVLDGGKCILQLRGVRPFMSSKFDITKHPNYKYLADFDKRNSFNIEKFLSTRLKPKPDEEYEVFKQYNEEMNSTRPREYDGSHITFAGMNPEIQLREHQKIHEEVTI